MATIEKQVIVVGVDDSEDSLYALQWTLEHFFTPFSSNCPYKLIIVHAKPPATTAIGVAGPGKFSIAFPSIYKNFKVACFMATSLRTISNW